MLWAQLLQNLSKWIHLRYRAIKIPQGANIQNGIITAGDILKGEELDWGGKRGQIVFATDRKAFERFYFFFGVCKALDRNSADANWWSSTGGFVTAADANWIKWAALFFSRKNNNHFGLFLLLHDLNL